MLRFDKTKVFLRIFKSNLLVSLSKKMCDSVFLLSSEFIYIVSIFINISVKLHGIDLIMLLYTLLVICFDWYKEKTICLISFNKLSELLPAFTCARAIGNLWSICLGVNVLILEWSRFKMPAPLNFVKNILLSKASRIFSLPSKKLY